MRELLNQRQGWLVASLFELALRFGIGHVAFRNNFSEPAIVARQLLRVGFGLPIRFLISIHSKLQSVAAEQPKQDSDGQKDAKVDQQHR